MRRELVLTAALALTPGLWAQPLSGVWDATIDFNGTVIPFRMGFSTEAGKVQGWFLNGDQRETSTSGSFENGKLELNFEDYATRLTATVKDGVLDGQWGPYQKKFYPVHAERSVARPASTAKAPSIDGVWFIEGVKSAKGETTWRLIVRQNGPEVTAGILRVDGDTGALSGRYENGKFMLSHFSGARPSLLVLTPQSDGSLDVTLIGLRNQSTYKALRPEEARAKGLPDPADPAKHTTVKSASEGFRFSFPDLNGNIVSSSDPRFRGKVVLVNISGSWCPNCHDEAPFLADLYRKYRNQGLEIVALSFEEADQLKDPARLRAFVSKYKIEYPVLICGMPDEAKDKLTNAENWDAWPTTFFIGRDGRVRSVHAGFPSSASGTLYTQAKEDFTAQVERLLAENKTTSR